MNHFRVGTMYECRFKCKNAYCCCSFFLTTLIAVAKMKNPTQIKLVLFLSKFLVTYLC